MAWFSSKEPQVIADDPIRPLSQQRVKDWLDGEGYFYSVDDDGDLGGRWDAAFIYFFIMGEQQEILNVSGRFLIPIPPDRVDEARLFIEDWHRDRIWPKAYILTDDQGNYRIAADVPLDHEHGVNDAQLAQHLKCGLGTISQCFEALRESLGLEWHEDD